MPAVAGKNAGRDRVAQPHRVADGVDPVPLPGAGLRRGRVQGGGAGAVHGHQGQVAAGAGLDGLGAELAAVGQEDADVGVGGGLFHARQAGLGLGLGGQDPGQFPLAFLEDDDQLAAGGAVRQPSQLAAGLVQLAPLEVEQLPAGGDLAAQFLQLGAVRLDHVLVGDDGGVGEKKAGSLAPGGLDGHGAVLGPFDGTGGDRGVLCTCRRGGPGGLRGGRR